jgi:hypothetical protein
LRIKIFIARANDYSDFLDSSRQRLFDQNLELGFPVGIAVNKSLKWQCALGRRSSRDYSFLD